LAKTEPDEVSKEQKIIILCQIMQKGKKRKKLECPMRIKSQIKKYIFPKPKNVKKIKRDIF